MVKEVVEQLRPVAPYHNFVVEALNDPIIGKWDCGRLQQALGNLLDNATKYSDEGTTITVRIWLTADAPKTVHISVHNQGVCISPEDIRQLFRPYARLQSAGTQRGSGLGLYITKSIIEAHRGQLRVDSSPDPEQGTTFTFDLPVQ